MASRKQKITVGVFLLCSLVVIASGIAIIAGLHQGHGIHYSIEFNESILGLYEGGMVEYLGVPVGKVFEIRVTENQRALVDVVIDPSKVQLRKGVEGKLVIYSLAAGSMAISLDGGDPGAPPLPPQSRIPTKPSTIAAVSSQAEVFMGDITSILSTINHALEGLEEGELSAIIKKINTLLDKGIVVVDDGQELLQETTATVKDIRTDASELLDHVTALSQDLRGLTADVNKLVQAANEKIVPLDLGTTQENFNEVLLNITDLTGQLNRAVTELGNVSANVTHQTGNIEYNLRITLEEVTDAFESLNQLVNQLKDDPGSLVRGKGKIKE